MQSMLLQQYLYGSYFTYSHVVSLCFLILLNTTEFVANIIKKITEPNLFWKNNVLNITDGSKYIANLNRERKPPPPLCSHIITEEINIPSNLPYTNRSKSSLKPTTNRQGFPHFFVY